MRLCEGGECVGAGRPLLLDPTDLPGRETVNVHLSKTRGVAEFAYRAAVSGSSRISLAVDPSADVGVRYVSESVETEFDISTLPRQERAVRPDLDLTARGRREATECRMGLEGDLDRLEGARENQQRVIDHAGVGDEVILSAEEPGRENPVGNVHAVSGMDERVAEGPETRTVQELGHPGGLLVPEKETTQAMSVDGARHGVGHVWERCRSDDDEEVAGRFGETLCRLGLARTRRCVEDPA
ncbi:hypothetical protein RQM47_17350 [Rubrivirga sp. S365]|uniref:hypothetical protein n=1 Tax=Rubrivirga sp. S365 TaxID=3076080 RepID=UPI0028C81898|nr:hypothetical protein [Rubrivirga sp. S365]MDT7858420.1 hypothetical protein [Rubrivirga sp. S365]